MFTVDPSIGDLIVLNNITDPGLTPQVLMDSNSDIVNGTVYEIINIFVDIGNSWTYITVDSPQNYGFVVSSPYLADVTITQISKNLFHNGSFLGGTWENGIFNNGTFQNALAWNNGIFNNGTFDSSIWNDGKFNNGVLSNSTWNDGKFFNGNFNGHTWNDGTFFDGEMRHGS